MLLLATSSALLLLAWTSTYVAILSCWCLLNTRVRSGGPTIKRVTLVWQVCLCFSVLIIGLECNLTSVFSPILVHVLSRKPIAATPRGPLLVVVKSLALWSWCTSTFMAMGGNSFLTLVDAFSSMPFCYPLRVPRGLNVPDSASVMEALVLFTSVHGVPSAFHSDRDPRFNPVSDTFKVPHYRTAAERAQSNGLVERMHSSLADVCRSLDLPPHLAVAHLRTDAQRGLFLAHRAAVNPPHFFQEQLQEVKHTRRPARLVVGDLVIRFVPRRRRSKRDPSGASSSMWSRW